MVQNDGRTILLSDLYPWPEGTAPGKAEYPNAVRKVVAAE
jgi:hypothetical protein